MSNPRGWRTLIRLKERRLEQLDAALDAARAQQRQRQAQLEALNAEATDCRAREDAQRARIHDLAGGAGGFRPSDLVTLQHLLEEAAKTTLAAAKRTQDGERQVEAARQAVVDAQRARQRGEQQLEGCRQRLENALKAEQTAQEDQQDEDAEEASVARLLAARPDHALEAA